LDIVAWESCRARTIPVRSRPLDEVALDAMPVPRPGRGEPGDPAADDQHAIGSSAGRHH
jgi:hypothetical protein